MTKRTTILAGALAPITAITALILMPAVASAENGGADLLALYGRMHAAMAADSAAGVVAAAGEIAGQAEAAMSGPHAEAFSAVEKAARAMTGADLETLREQFLPLSTAMAKLVEAGALAGADIYYCSMAEGYWLQTKNDSAVKNPYYGKSMLTCGWKVDKVEG